MKTTSHIADGDSFTFTATLASMVMYVECLLVVGVSYEEAKARAIDQTSFLGFSRDQKGKLIEILMAYPIERISRFVRQTVIEAAYLAAIRELHLKDTWIRRCLYMRFGIML